MRSIQVIHLQPQALAVVAVELAGERVVAAVVLAVAAVVLAAVVVGAVLAASPVSGAADALKVSKTNPRFDHRYIIYSSLCQCLIFDSDRYHQTTVVLLGCEVENRSIRLNGLEFESRYELKI